MTPTVQRAGCLKEGRGTHAPRNKAAPSAGDGGEYPSWRRVWQAGHAPPSPPDGRRLGAFPQAKARHGRRVVLGARGRIRNPVCPHSSFPVRVRDVHARPWPSILISMPPDSPRQRPSESLPVRAGGHSGRQKNDQGGSNGASGGARRQWVRVGPNVNPEVILVAARKALLSRDLLPCSTGRGSGTVTR